MGIIMEKIKLNTKFGHLSKIGGYMLDPTKKYIINIGAELEEQAAIIKSIQTTGLDALGDYHKWLEENDFDVDMPNPNNVFVGTYYGIRPLWNTKQSRGVVVRAEGDDDYYIVMECSRLIEGYKGTQIILTLGGCL